MSSERARIPVAEPAFVGNEKQYVMECLESGWISSNGEFIERFETRFAEFCGVRHAVSCCNGTVALHLALLALGIGPGDEVIVPTLTFVATANTVMYCGARPVFVDSEPGTWNVDPLLVEQAITSRTKAIIVVHLYGHPAEMGPILETARRHHVPVVEDAAEAHGAEYRGARVGSIGDLATFSFYGNKILTTGEGGMVTTNDAELALKIRRLKGQGMDPNRRYWFPMIGYNYRMTNIAAALGLGQLENADWHIEQRRRVAQRYAARLGAVPGIMLQVERPWVRNVFWMTCVVLEDGQSERRDALMLELARAGIETRPFFYPMHTLPMYRELGAGCSFPVAERAAAGGINLPSSATLSDDEIDYVCDCLTECLADRPAGSGRLRLDHS